MDIDVPSDPAPPAIAEPVVSSDGGEGASPAALDSNKDQQSDGSDSPKPMESSTVPVKEEKDDTLGKSAGEQLVADEKVLQKSEPVNIGNASAEEPVLADHKKNLGAEVALPEADSKASSGEHADSNGTHDSNKMEDIIGEDDSGKQPSLKERAADLMSSALAEHLLSSTSEIPKSEDDSEPMESDASSVGMSDDAKALESLSAADGKVAKQEDEEERMDTSEAAESPSKALEGSSADKEDLPNGQTGDDVSASLERADEAVDGQNGSHNKKGVTEEKNSLVPSPVQQPASGNVSDHVDDQALSSEGQVDAEKSAADHTIEVSEGPMDPSVRDMLNEIRKTNTGDKIAEILKKKLTGAELPTVTGESASGDREAGVEKTGEEEMYTSSSPPFPPAADTEFTSSSTMEDPIQDLPQIAEDDDEDTSHKEDKKKAVEEELASSDVLGGEEKHEDAGITVNGSNDDATVQEQHDSKPVTPDSQGNESAESETAADSAGNRDSKSPVPSPKAVKDEDVKKSDAFEETTAKGSTGVADELPQIAQNDDKETDQKEDKKNHAGEEFLSVDGRDAEKKHGDSEKAVNGCNDVGNSESSLSDHKEADIEKDAPVQEKNDSNPATPDSHDEEPLESEPAAEAAANRGSKLPVSSPKATGDDITVSNGASEETTTHGNAGEAKQDALEVPVSDALKCEDIEMSDNSKADESSQIAQDDDKETDQREEEKNGTDTELNSSDVLANEEKLGESGNAANGSNDGVNAQSSLKDREGEDVKEDVIFQEQHDSKSPTPVSHGRESVEMDSAADSAANSHSKSPVPSPKAIEDNNADSNDASGETITKGSAEEVEPEALKDSETAIESNGDVQKEVEQQKTSPTSSDVQEEEAMEVDPATDDTANGGGPSSTAPVEGSSKAGVSKASGVTAKKKKKRVVQKLGEEQEEMDTSSSSSAPGTSQNPPGASQNAPGTSQSALQGGANAGEQGIGEPAAKKPRIVIANATPRHVVDLAKKYIDIVVNTRDIGDAVQNALAKIKACPGFRPDADADADADAKDIFVIGFDEPALKMAQNVIDWLGTMPGEFKTVKVMLVMPPTGVDIPEVYRNIKFECSFETPVKRDPLEYYGTTLSNLVQTIKNLDREETRFIFLASQDSEHLIAGPKEPLTKKKMASFLKSPILSDTQKRVITRNLSDLKTGQLTHGIQKGQVYAIITHNSLDNEDPPLAQVMAELEPHRQDLKEEMLEMLDAIEGRPDLENLYYELQVFPTAQILLKKIMSTLDKSKYLCHILTPPTTILAPELGQSIASLLQGGKLAGHALTKGKRFTSNYSHGVVLLIEGKPFIVNKDDYGDPNQEVALACLHELKSTSSKFDFALFTSGVDNFDGDEQGVAVIFTKEDVEHREPANTAEYLERRHAGAFWETFKDATHRHLGGIKEMECHQFQMLVIGGSSADHAAILRE